jgi:C-terminal processing protease CtpA/Prc
VEERTPRAVRTSAIVESSPASEANIAVGDELLEIDGHAASTMTLAQIRDVLRSEPGRRLTLKFRRGSSVLEKTVVLRKMA